MNFKIILFIILGFLLFNCLTQSHAFVRRDTDEDFMPDDTTRKPDHDSLMAVRKHIADSIKVARANASDSLKDLRANKADSLKDARAHIADSVKKAHAVAGKQLKSTRKHAADSIKAYHKHISDSTAAARKGKNSSKGKSSLTKAKQAKADSIKTARKEHIDSVTRARKDANKSITSARKAKTDSIKAIQKHRTDSLARIRKYKTSRRYTDSVQIVRHERADSIRAARETFKDSLATTRKHSLDSAKIVRKHSADSVKVIRTHFTDSLKTVRKHRSDSLLKAKEAREKLAKGKEKATQDKKKAVYELKLKQKREAWSNKSMLKKNWSPYRRLTQNSFTHYNYYYNSNRKLEEAELNMQRTKKENYDSLIGLYPFDPNRDSATMKADMDSIIHKVSVGIQIHDPRNKWANDMFLILGQAQYYKGNYNQSAIAFRYIITSDEAKERKAAAERSKNSNSKEKEQPSVLEDYKSSKLDFLKHKPVHNDAVLWLARTYSSSHQTENAGAVISMIEGDPKLHEEMQGRLAVEKANMYLADYNYNSASPELAIAADDENLPSWLRMRAAFLNGQIQQNNGQYEEAASSFHNVLDFHPKPEMEFYARRNFAYNSLLAGSDPAIAMEPLKSVLTDGKFVTYYDQVYYIMGKLAQKSDNKEDAEKYFTKSVTTPKASKKQKAISFAALGEMSYAGGDYSNAKNYYDSSAKYAPNASKDSNVAIAVQRSKGLAEIAAPAMVIHEQDSLLALSALSPKEQQAAVRRYLRYLQQKMEDSLQNLDNSGVTAVALQTRDDDNDMANWYFSNPVNMQQGSGEFKKKWGSRPLSDNWGRAAAQTATGISDPLDNLASSAGSGEIDENGLPTEEALLAKIPNKKYQKDLAIKMEQRSYIMLAKAYVKQLEDYKQAIHTLDTLDQRYPNHNQKEEELYLRYQIAVKQNKLDKAQKYSQELLLKYPESQYASMLRPREDGKNDVVNNTGVSVNAYYDETYNLIMQHQYSEAMLRIKTAQTRYDNPTYNKRFEVAKVLCYAGSGNLKQADTLINTFIKNNPGDSLIGWANSISDYLKDVQKNGVPSWYNDSSYFKEDSTQAKIAKKKKKYEPPPPPPPPKVEVPKAYANNQNDPHYCIVLIPGIDSRTAQLKHRIYSFNSGRQGADSLKVLLDMYGGHSAVLLVRKFSSATDARAYMNDIKASDVITGFQPDELRFRIISEKNYLKMYYDKDIPSYLSYYDASYR